MIKSLLKKYLIHLLVLLGLVAVFGVLFNSGNLVYGDLAATFYAKQDYYLKHFLHAWLNNSFMGYEAVFYNVIRLPFYLLHDGIYLVFSYHRWWLFLVVIYYLRYYLFYQLLRYEKQPKEQAVLIALLYSFSFFFLDRFGHVFILFGSMTVPLFVMALDGYLSTGKQRNLWLLLFAMWIILSSMHVVLMTMYFAIPYVVYLAIKNKHNLLIFCLRLFLVLGLSTTVFMHILLPWYQSGLVDDQNIITNVRDRSSEVIFIYSAKSHLPLTSVGAGFHDSAFFGQPIIELAVLIISFIVFLQIIKHRPQNNREKLFLICYYLALGLMTIDVVRPLIGPLRSLLFGFGSIKDSSYFGLYVTFCLFIILASIIRKGWSANIRRYITAAVVIMISLNVYLLRTSHQYRVSQVPESYQQLSTLLPDNRRILILPTGWVASAQWSNDDIMSGFFNLNLSDKEIVGQTIVEGPSQRTNIRLVDIINCFNDGCTGLTDKFRELAIRDVLVMKNYNRDVSQKEDAPSTAEVITRLVDQGVISKQYENDDYEIYTVVSSEVIRPVISGADIDYQYISPTKYLLSIHNVAKETDLDFLNSFHPNWQLYQKPYEGQSCSTVVETYVIDDHQIRECQTGIATPLDDLQYISPSGSFIDTHTDVYGYANGWTLSPISIRNELDQTNYRVNRDGSIDLELVLLYRGELYMTAGFIVSAATLVLLLLISLVLWGTKKDEQPTV